MSNSIEKPTLDDVLDWYSIAAEETSVEHALDKTIKRHPQFEAELREFAAFKESIWGLQLNGKRLNRD